MGKITGCLCAKDNDLDKRGNLMVPEVCVCWGERCDGVMKGVGLEY